MGLLLFTVAIILFIPLTGINLTLVLVKSPRWKTLDGYFHQTAIDIDRFGNRNFRTLLNDTLIKESPFRFGDPRETISSVLGKNKEIGTLTYTGYFIVNLLDWIDPNHCQKSIRWYV
jgi:hypothetical protein